MSRIFWCNLIEVFDDHSTVWDNQVIMHKCWHNRLRIDLLILGCELLTCKNIDVNTFPLHALFRHRKANLSSAY